MDTRGRTAADSIPSVVAAAGLVGGFALGRTTGRRGLAGAAFGLAGAWCVRQWTQRSGLGTAALLTGTYVGAMGAAHPLAKRLGPWPAVGIATAVVVAASEATTGPAGR